MTSLERFYATIERRPVDYPAAWLGMPDVDTLDGLFAHYKVESLHELKLVIGDDFYAVEVPYQSETSDAIHAAFDWYGDGGVDSHNRTLTAQGLLHDAETVEEVESFDWPDPAKYIDPEECRRRVELAPKDKATIGILWAAHFQDTCAAFGMEEALMKMITHPEVYKAVDRKIMDFYLKAAEIFYEATTGSLHSVLIGNDFGSQRGLMLSPDMIREFVIPGAAELIQQAHAYDIKVIYHSCGSIVEVIPDLVAAGADTIHPIQALAKDMDPENLKNKFGDSVSFCGGVDTQDLLVNGSPEEVEATVKKLRTLFPTGLIVSPSHEAILPDVPPANIEAMFRATKAPL